MVDVMIPWVSVKQAGKSSPAGLVGTSFLPIFCLFSRSLLIVEVSGWLSSDSPSGNDAILKIQCSESGLL